MMQMLIRRMSNNTGVLLVGQSLQVTDGGGTINTDLTSLVDDSDWVISGSDLYSAVSGDVGIGTATPSDKLHVFDSGNNGDMMIQDNFPFLTFNRNAGTGNMGIVFQDVGVTKGVIYWSNADEALVITTNSGGPPDLFASSTGPIGINTSSPTARLHVQGTGSTNTTDAFIVQNSAGTDLFHI